MRSINPTTLHDITSSSRRGVRLLGQGGFTLIEVVLVLAIGGLIFLLAFIAFNQVQKNRRDTQRRNDAKRMVAYLIDSAANNGGSHACTTYFNGYVSETFTRTSRNAQLSRANRCPGLAQILSQDKSFNLPAEDNPAYLAYNDPSVGGAYYMYVRNTPYNYPLGRLTVYIGAKCSGSNLEPVNSVGAFAVRLRLESGGYYCTDSGAT